MNTPKYGFGLTSFSAMMIFALLASVDAMATGPIEDFNNR